MLTLDILNQSLPHILSAPKDKAPLHILCTRPNFGKRQFVTTLSLDAHKGVEGDGNRWLLYPWLKTKEGKPDPNIQVSILGLRLYQLISQHYPDSVHPGDTMIADMDFSEDNLPNGSLLQIGEVILKVSNVFNTGCIKWRKRYNTESFQWINQPEHLRYRLRGILCSIEQGGKITLADQIIKI